MNELWVLCCKTIQIKGKQMSSLTEYLHWGLQIGLLKYYNLVKHPVGFTAVSAFLHTLSYKTVTLSMSSDNEVTILDELDLREARPERISVYVMHKNQLCINCPIKLNVTI